MRKNDGGYYDDLQNNSIQILSLSVINLYAFHNMIYRIYIIL